MTVIELAERPGPSEAPMRRPDVSPDDTDRTGLRVSTRSGAVLLSVPGGHHVEDLLRGPFFESLLAPPYAPRVTVVSPFVADTQLATELRKVGVDAESLPLPRGGAASRVVESILSERFLLESRLRAVRLQRDRARLLDQWPGRRALIALKGVLSRLPVSRQRWFSLAQAVTDLSDCGRLLDRHRPDLVVTSTAGFLAAEVPLIYAARKQQIPVMGIDLGWDNLSSKYHTVRPVDHLAVWNESMRDEAVRYHQFTPDQVRVTGAVPFDTYFAGAEFPSRERLFASIGADPALPLVTLATAPALVYPTTSNVARLLAVAAVDGRFGSEVQLLVRVHSRDQLADYDGLQDGRRVFVEKPFQQLERGVGQPELDAFTPGAGGRGRLAATLAHSDVVVNFASTTTIEAALFDTPVVNIGFDSEAGLPLPLSIRRYYEYEHYQPVIETGAAQVAWSEAELIDVVGAYLRDPSLDRVGRQALVRHCCAFPEGGAGRRLAQWVRETLVRRCEQGGRS